MAFDKSKKVQNEQLLYQKINFSSHSTLNRLIPANRQRLNPEQRCSMIECRSLQKQANHATLH